MIDEDRLLEIEHTLGRADDDLTRVTEDVRKLERENTELRALLHSVCEALDRAPKFLAPLPDGTIMGSNRALSSVGLVSNEFKAIVSELKEKTKPRPS